MCWYDVVHISTGCSWACAVNFHHSAFGLCERKNVLWGNARMRNGNYFCMTLLLILLRDWKRKCLLTAPVAATCNEWHHPGWWTRSIFPAFSHTSNSFFPCGFIPLIFASCHNNVSNTLYLWQLMSNSITSVVKFSEVFLYGCHSSHFLEISHYLGQNQVAQQPATHCAFYSGFKQTCEW